MMQLSKSQVSETAKTVDDRVAEFPQAGRPVIVHVLVVVGVNDDSHQWPLADRPSLRGRRQSNVCDCRDSE